VRGGGGEGGGGAGEASVLPGNGLTARQRLLLLTERLLRPSVLRWRGVAERLGHPAALQNCTSEVDPEAGRGASRADSSTNPPSPEHKRHLTLLVSARAPLLRARRFPRRRRRCPGSSPRGPRLARSGSGLTGRRL
jgi:hypothetical protein